MGRRKRQKFEYEEGRNTEQDTAEVKPSRSQGKRDAKAAAALALRLVDTAPGKLESLELDPELMSEILDCQKLKRTARQRQLKYVSGILRDQDWRMIERMLADL